MATFSWIHFSDLHWSKETKNYWINKSQLLYKDIMDFKTKDSLDFNAVFVTGDLVRNGNADEYELLKTEWLNPLADEFSKMNSYPKLFIVPGNHDLKRPNSNKILQIIGNDWDEKFWEAQNQDSRTLKSIKSLFQNYNDWWKKSERRMPKVANPEIGFLPGDFAYTFTLDEDCSIGIIGLNTAFLDLKDGCNGKLEVGIKQTKTLCGGEDFSEWFEAHDGCIIITHHPSNWFSERAQTVFFNKIAPEGRFLLHLCGHHHENEDEHLKNSLYSKSMRTIQGKALFSPVPYTYVKNGQIEKKNRRQHGYIIGRLEIDTDEMHICIWPRILNTDLIFEPDPDFCKDKGTDYIEFTLPRKKNRIKPVKKITPPHIKSPVSSIVLNIKENFKNFSNKIIQDSFISGLSKVLQIDQDKIFIRALERGENIVSMIELPKTAIDLLIKLANSSDSQITNLGILPISTDEREQKPNKDDSKGTKIGKYQGAILSETIEGYPGTIRCLSFHPKGQILASGSDDTTITLWNTKSSELIHVLKGHFSYVMSLAFSPDGSRLASGSNDSTIKIWEVASRQLLRTFNGHLERVNSVVFDPSGKFLYSGSFDSKIKLWNVTTGELLKTLEGHKHRVNGLILIPDQNILVSGSDDFTIKLWDTRNNQEIRMLEGHTNNVVSLDFNPKKKILASGSFDKTIKIWDMSGGYSHKNLLGHTGEIDIVRFSADGQLLASKSKDGTIRIWSCDTWQTVVVIQEPTLGRWISGLSFNPKETLLAAIGSAPDVPHNEKCRQIRLWKFDTDILCRKMKNDEIVDNNAVQDKINYITAKLVLVGDSGVGKTGLGWRLAHGKFKEHSSTHGQQFWVVDNLCTTRKDGTECEAVLWDLAGQHIYRSIHAIFLNKVDASLILFDPSNRQDPLKGIQFWLEQLKGKGQLPPTVLVGARVDRGAPSLSQDYLSQFCQRYDIKGGYISTSAKSGEGLEELINLLKKQIPWDNMKTTVTTVTFKRIKDYVLALKEKPNHEGALMRSTELRKQLQETDSNWQFTDAEMMTSVGHLETHGYVTILKNSSGDEYILLTPDLLINLTSSIFLLADNHPRELGAVSEKELLKGDHSFKELNGLDKTERDILLDAAVLLFLEHKVCFRETFDNDTLLIFPGLIKQRRPLGDDFQAIDDMSYLVRGRVENLYAMLVVLLGYTPSFTRINQWQSQAQYQMGKGEICGFRMIEDREGEIELVLYYSEHMPQRRRASFQELFERFLYQHEVEIKRFSPVMCLENHKMDRTTVIRLIREGKTFAFCAECGGKVDLPDLDNPDISIKASAWLQWEGAAARLRSTYEEHLARIKSYRRSWTTPCCYLSYAPEEENYVTKIIHDLQDAGVYIIKDAKQIKSDDYVIVLDTPAYQLAWRELASTFETEVNLVKSRLSKDNRHLISIKLGDVAGSSTLHDLQNCSPGDFCDETHYPVSLFDLVLNLYAIPFTHAGFTPLRKTLHKQWEQTLAGFSDESKNMTTKIFISYSHKDETFKNELVKMLAGLQRRGVVDAWQDRGIEPGEEWFKAIKQAINESDVAVLLISSDFIASRFINDEELPDLLKRREKEGMIIIPIIVRDCLWQSEPVLKDLQVLPTDGKAVIKFPEVTGERDQVWTEIAQAIEHRVKI